MGNRYSILWPWDASWTGERHRFDDMTSRCIFCLDNNLMLLCNVPSSCMAYFMHSVRFGGRASSLFSFFSAWELFAYRPIFSAAMAYDVMHAPRVSSSSLPVWSFQAAWQTPTEQLSIALPFFLLYLSYCDTRILTCTWSMNDFIDFMLSALQLEPTLCIMIVVCE